MAQQAGVPTLLARDADEAGAVARPFLAAGTPVVVKILSPEIVHKSDVGGVRLDLASRNDSGCSKSVRDRGINTPSPSAQSEQLRLSYFTIDRDNPLRGWKNRSYQTSLQRLRELRQRDPGSRVPV
jgi:hypothetical protein